VVAIGLVVAAGSRVISSNVVHLRFGPVRR
jgi:hypothetical protein